MRDTLATRIVLRALLARSPRWGYEIGVEYGLKPHVVTAVLRRLLVEGFAVDRWEEPEAGTARAVRRYYELTPTGRERAEAVGPVSGAA